MKRAVLVAIASALPLTLCVPVLHAQGTQGAAAAIDASNMPESGPVILGGSQQTVGPNSKNQAVMPMPGMGQDEQLSQLPPDAALPPPLVHPVPGPQPSPLRPRATR